MIITLAKHPEFSARMAAEQCFGITCDSTEISALTIYGVGFGNRKTAVSRKGECAKSGEIRDGGAVLAHAARVSEQTMGQIIEARLTGGDNGSAGGMQFWQWLT
jgi:hypothetical protein